MIAGYRKGSVKWDFRSWDTHWPAGNEPLECCSHAIVTTFTRVELGCDTRGQEYTGRGNISDVADTARWQKKLGLGPGLN